VSNANFKKLFLFALRRDRIWLSIWVAGIVALAVLCAPLFPTVAKTQPERDMFAVTMKNPAMVALCGPIYSEPYTYGVMYGQLMTIWLLLLIGIVNFFLVAAHTRKDEEEGRFEVLLSLPVGKASILTSTWALSFLANLAAGLLSALGIAACGIESMGLSGSLIIGALIFATGMLFSAIAMLFCQLCASSRAMIGWSFLSMGVLYMVSAIGSVAQGPVSFISPLGLAFKAEPYAGNYAWPVFAILAEAAVIGAFAMKLSLSRDLGSGLIPARKGKAHAGSLLSSPFGLVLRLGRTSLIIWAISLFVIGALYGSIFGDLEAFLAENEMLQALMQASPDSNMSLSFMAYIVLIMSNIAAIPAVSQVLRLRAEERKNRLESIYACSVSKPEHFLCHLALAFPLSIVLQTALSIGLWAAASSVMDDPITIADILLSGYALLPGIWLLIGLSAFLVGFFPKHSSLVWAYFGFSFFVVYIGRMANLPKFLEDIAAFSAISNYPVESFELAPFILVTFVSLALSGLGLLFYSRRDVRHA
jgi:ABC-2 type transport system permease protein